MLRFADNILDSYSTMLKFRTQSACENVTGWMNQFCDDVCVRNYADQLTARHNRTVRVYLIVDFSTNRLEATWTVAQTFKWPLFTHFRLLSTARAWVQHSLSLFISISCVVRLFMTLYMRSINACIHFARCFSVWESCIATLNKLKLSFGIYF